MSSRETEISRYLVSLGATVLAAERAARQIAARWADREFWWSATARPVEACVQECPEMPPPWDVVRGLEVALGVRVHEIAAWDPGW